jgi:hypothetical protein
LGRGEVILRVRCTFCQSRPQTKKCPRKGD